MREKHAIKINMSYILTNISVRILHITYIYIYICRTYINVQCMHHKWWNCAGPK